MSNSMMLRPSCLVPTLWLLAQATPAAHAERCPPTTLRPGGSEPSRPDEQKAKVSVWMFGWQCGPDSTASVKQPYGAVARGRPGLLRGVAALRCRVVGELEDAVPTFDFRGSCRSRGRRTPAPNGAVGRLALVARGPPRASCLGFAGDVCGGWQRRLFGGLCCARSAAVAAQDQPAVSAVFQAKRPMPPAGPALMGQGCAPLLLDFFVAGQHRALIGAERELWGRAMEVPSGKGHRRGRR